MSDFPDRENQFAQREELARAWAIVDHQTAEIEELEKRHAALVAAAEEAWGALASDWGGPVPDEVRQPVIEALRATIDGEPR